MFTWIQPLGANRLTVWRRVSTSEAKMHLKTKICVILHILKINYRSAATQHEEKPLHSDEEKPLRGANWRGFSPGKPK